MEVISRFGFAYIKLNPENAETIERFLLKNPHIGSNQGNTILKVKNNIYISHWAVNIWCCFGPDALIMYLDGDECRTTNMLLEAGGLPQNCIPVNNNLEIAMKLKSITKNAICADFTDALDMLTDDALKRLRFVWYDGCGTILGKEGKNSPLDDITKLLSIMPGNFIFAYTFSARANTNRSRVDHLVENGYKKQQKRPGHLRQSAHYKSPSPKNRGMTVDEQVTILIKAIEKSGYQYRILSGKTNYATMSFFKCWLFK